MFPPHSRLLLVCLALAACRTAPKDDTVLLEDTGGLSNDADGDGLTGAADCDEADASVHAEAEEICDGVDNNCDGQIDEGVLNVYYGDVDGDGFGDPTTTYEACAPAAGQSTNPNDCDDSDASVHPGAEELCDSIDNNCDGIVDDGDIQTWYADVDGDGFGDSETTIEECAPPSGWVLDSSDCDDADGEVHPDATEVCNEVDDDCDDTVDEGVTEVFYRDEDGDGYGQVGSTTDGCRPPEGYAETPGDCDDAEAAVYPGATEVCNDIDDDCDGLIDIGATDASTWYADTDSDGYGAPSTATDACDQPTGMVADSDDCDDTTAAVSPAATEVCNGIDDDCDGLTDDDDSSVDTATATTWYDDDDGDLYGDASASTVSCDAPSSTAVTDSTDCDDTSASINPGETEVCNSIDDDCDALIDDDDSSLDASTGSTFYDDDDGDGYGDASVSSQACLQPSGTVTTTTDCDDTDSAIHPGASERCNLEDDDCDGTIDDGTMGSGAACPAESCNEILADQPSSSSGSYYIDFDGAATSTTCDMVTDGGGWTLIFSDDFESTPHSGWSLSSTYSCGSWSNLLGGYGIMAGGEIDILIDIYGVTHTEAWVELEYMALDSWDGETAYVTADGITLFSQSQNNHTSVYGEVCGWNRGYYGSYDSTHTIDDDFAHTDDELELIAGSTLDQSATDESFGIDDVMLWVR